MKRFLMIFVALFLINCGGEENEPAPTKPCNLLVGDYEITNTITKTDCPEVFGEADNKPHNDGTIWIIEDSGLKCGETKEDVWKQTVYTASCKCYLTYYDNYHSITENSFVVDRKIDLECSPYLDSNDDFCNKKCSTDGFIEGKRIEDDQVKSGQ
jgi:hypothetical protein